MSDRMLISGRPVPENRSHTEIDPATGMQRDYIVLSPEERAKGFVKPVRRTYLHKCGVATTMGTALAETYARNPRFYSGTFCCGCRAHFPLNEFTWDKDGEPMDPDLQPEWEAGRADREAQKAKERRELRIEMIKRELSKLNSELAALQAEQP